MDTPRYPVKVRFRDGDDWTLNDEMEIAATLEWFDSEAPDQDAVATDAAGRRLRIIVRNHVISQLILKQ